MVNGKVREILIPEVLAYDSFPARGIFGAFDVQKRLLPCQLSM
jgi:hypothetical protein